MTRSSIYLPSEANAPRKTAWKWVQEKVLREIQRLMVPAHFHDGRPTDDKIWCKNRRNCYLSRRTYLDTSVELLEARVALKRLDMFRTFTTTPEGMYLPRRIECEVSFLTVGLPN